MIPREVDLSVANTILAQLGGQRFRAMTGCKDLIGTDNSLTFKINGVRGDGRKVNGVRIVLDPSDTYTVEALYVRMRPAYKRTVVESASDIYNENLQDVFTRLTGLATSLGRMGRS